MLRARDVMTEQVCWLHADRTLEDGYKSMLDHNCRHLPIVDESIRLLGVISRSDILKSCYHIHGNFFLPEVRLIDRMTKEVVTCSPKTPLGDVVATMMACKINCVPVVEDKILVGIITATDIFDLYCRSEESNGHSLMPIDFVERGFDAVRQRAFLRKRTNPTRYGAGFCRIVEDV